jgi:CBS domain-containing protein
MHTISKPLFALTADDLMNRKVVRLPQEMPLRDAARLLLCNQVSGAPVVDAQGRCRGVFSAIDYLRLAEAPQWTTQPALSSRPTTCTFQVKHFTSDGKEVILCTLPPDVCPIQVKERGPDGEGLLVCSQPHVVLTDWQFVDMDRLPTDEVQRFMTVDPVTAPPTTPLSTLAGIMVDAHIHRVIIIDEAERPIGIVSSTDLLAAIARSSGER